MKTIEKSFKTLINKLDELNHENFIHVDLEFLQKHDLLHFHQLKASNHGLTRYFQVIESFEKITLINEEFVVWIVPENIDGRSVIYTLVALNEESEPKLELVFLLSGVYNSSQLVLKVLEKLLLEIEETESLLKSMS